MRNHVLLLFAGFAIILSACATSTPTEATMTNQLTIKSDAFASGQSIPAKYSCTGRNISPPLAWNEPPTGNHPLR